MSHPVLRVVDGPPRAPYALISYDVNRRRVWVGCNRLHHGLTGVLVAALGLFGLVAHSAHRGTCLELTLLGSALMAHDLHDLPIWFRPSIND